MKPRRKSRFESWQSAHCPGPEPSTASQTSRLALRLWHLALGALLAAAPANLLAQTNDNDRGYWIADTDSGMLAFDERAGSVTVNVRRLGDYDFPSSVHYHLATIDDSGVPGGTTAGLDFLPTEGALDFGAGDTNKTFTLTILDDGLIEGEETLFIVLDQPSAGVGIGTPSVTVLIRDNEQNAMRVDPDFKPDWRPERDIRYYLPLVAVQPTDGKILLGTLAAPVTGEDGELLVRLLPDGQPDPAWQTPAINGTVGLLVPQPNGQVLIAAARNYWLPDAAGDPLFSVNGVARRHLARLNGDGSLDAPFSVSLPTEGTLNLVVTSLALQQNGQVLIAARPDSPFGIGNSSLFRTHPSGALDTSFQPPTPGDIGVIVETPDSKILVAPSGGGPLVRLNPDGSRDEQFQAPPDLRVLAIQPDGRLLVTVYSDDGTCLLARLTAEGTLDSTFTPFNYQMSMVDAVVPAANGKIWIVGLLPHSTRGVPFSRRNAGGSDDPTWPPAFLEGGYLLGFMSEKCFRVLELADGNLLFASITSPGHLNGQPRLGLARLLVNAPLPRFEVDPSCAIVPENSGRATITLLRCGTNTESVTVVWQTEGGSARPGVDYVPASGTLTFPPNESVATLELDVLDNAAPDEDRTVRLRLQGPPPGTQDYPPVEITIANEELGFPPGGIKRFPNGRVWLRPTGVWLRPTGPWTSQAWYPSAIVETSSNLQDWIETDIGTGSPPSIGPGGTTDTTAPINSPRFYRLRKREWP